MEPTTEATTTVAEAPTKGKPGRKPTGTKPRIAVTLPADFVHWLDTKCGGPMYRSRFIVEFCTEWAKQKERESELEEEAKLAIAAQRRKIAEEQAKLARMEQEQWEKKNKQSQ